MKKTSILNSYMYLFSASSNALNLAPKNKGEKFLNYMTAMLFSAFCIEAFLNHLLMHKFKFWEILKGKLSPSEKLSIVAKELDIDLDYSRRPFQSFKSIFKFRNLLVHAKTEHLSAENYELPEEEDESWYRDNPRSEWQEMVTFRNANQFNEDTKKIVEFLYSKMNLDGDPWAFSTDTLYI